MIENQARMEVVYCGGCWARLHVPVGLDVLPGCPRCHGEAGMPEEPARSRTGSDRFRRRPAARRFRR